MKLYSTNNEDFDHKTAEDAAQQLWDDPSDEGEGEPKAGDVVTIYEGDCRKAIASELLPDVAEILMDQAYNEAGESSEDWEFTEEQSESLQEVMKNALDAWATANDMQPKFCTVVKSRAVQMRFTDESGNSERV